MDRLLSRLLLLTLLLIPAAQAKPLAPAEAPEPLKPWIGWALKGEESRVCPFLFEDANNRRCAWPTRLDLAVDDRQGSFRMVWEVQLESRVPLPGSAEIWPQQVEIDGKPALVSASGAGDPVTMLQPGAHTITGRLLWDSLPESVPVPRETGLIGLSVKGQATAVAFNDQGQLWIEGGMREPEERPEIANRLDVQVFRRIADETPLKLTTWLSLDVSGAQREVLLEGASLPQFIPLALDSPLPARLEPDGRLRLQIRPGHWDLQVTARSPQELQSLALPPAYPEPWPGQEIWSFEAHADLRTVEVEGPPALDPQQTNMPEAWKSLPAYRLEPGQTMAFRVLRKGDPEPEPDQLNLHRILWLDFDGGGYTVNDEITGSMRRNWRLNVEPPLQLGRVSLDGAAQPITRLSGTDKAGVEVRRGQVRLSADSRYETDVARMAALGWDQDFRSVSARLNLPPGWKLLSASGVDNAPETWVGRWTLLDLFMVLIGALAVTQLWGWPQGLLALAALTLLWQEPEAPHGIWLNLLAATALLRVLPEGRFAQVVGIYRNLVFAGLVLIALPFMVEQIRLGIYPQLEQPWWQLASSSPMSLAPAPAPEMAMGVASEMETKERGLANRSTDKARAKFSPEMAMDMASEMETKESGLAHRSMDMARAKLYEAGSLSVAAKPGGATYSAARLREIDPDAITQTGPGLPSWNWNSVTLSWNGPVMRGQTLGLVLLSPAVNRILNLLRVMLLLALAWVMIGGGKGPDRKPIVGWVRRASKTDTEPCENPDARRNPPNQARRRDRNSMEGEASCRGADRNVTASDRWSVVRWGAWVLALSLGATGLTKADYPTEAMLQQLKSRLLEAPECMPRCAEIADMRVKLSAAELHVQLDVHVEQAVAIPLPGQEDQWLPGRLTVDGAPATALLRSNDGRLWTALRPGRHEVMLSGVMPQREEVIVPLPLLPRHVAVEGSGWAVQGIGDNGVPEEQLQFSRESPVETKPADSLEPRPLPVFLEIDRTLQLGLDWHVQTTVRRVSPADVPATVEVPLLEGESVTSADLTVRNGKVLVNLTAGAGEMSWESVLEKRLELHLQAPDTQAWTEVWRVDASPIWHLETHGLAPIHHQDSSGNWLPEWRPWPGESVGLSLQKPEGVPGASLTIDSSTLTVKPGQRATDYQLKLSLRSTQGGQHAIKLPEGAALQSALVNGVGQPLRQQGRTVSLPVHPGTQHYELNWREETGIAGRFAVSPVDLGVDSVNASQSLELGRDRWVLLAGGPRLGPAILFWGVLVVLLVIAIGLARLPLTPLRSWQWLLLLVGLSQLDIAAAAVVVAWLLALGWRRKENGKLGPRWFNLLQIGLSLLTLAAMSLLFAAVEHGLLGLPDMQVAGNHSTATELNWYQDRSPAILPTPWLVSAPLWSYRVCMLLWALWLAYSLLKWLRWGWECLGTGGLWRGKTEIS